MAITKSTSLIKHERNKNLTKIIIFLFSFFLAASCNHEPSKSRDSSIQNSPNEKPKNSTEDSSEVIVDNDIDKRFNDCIADNGSTMGMLDCYDIAIEEWTKEMNKYYNLLLRNLNKTERKKLILAQSKWLEFSELELQFNNEFYGNMDGSIWPIIGLNETMEKVKNRALNFKAHYGAITGDAIRGN